jgi:hypothetical protein
MKVINGENAVKMFTALVFSLCALALMIVLLGCTQNSSKPSSQSNSGSLASNSTNSTSWSTLQKQIEQEGFTIIDHKTANNRYFILQHDNEYSTTSDGDYYVTCYTLSGSQTGGAGPYSKSTAQSIFNETSPRMDWSIE